MFRLIFLPLLLVTISIACMGQTFQYSRGWTNGKRSSYGPGPGPAPATAAGVLSTHFRRDDDIGLPELFEMQEAEHRMEKCLFQLQQFIRNPLQLRRGAAVLSPGYSSSSSSSSNNNMSNNRNLNNNLFGNRHQSSELLEDLSGGEPSDYLKH